MTQSLKEDSAGIRTLRFLAQGSARLRAAAAANSFLLDGGERGVIGVGMATLVRLEKRALVKRVGADLLLTGAGRSALKEMLVAAGALRTQPAIHDEAVIEAEDRRETVTVNLAESPLALLHRRKGKNGKLFIDEREFRAGERLRADYTRGQIMPRLGINWESIGMAGGRSDRAGGIFELTDAVLAARRRVEEAIEAVGPELSGVLIDICCFLKGMEQVEMERSWPARSAKVVLKSALGALARHYEPQWGDARARARPAILHWGTQDYRPTIGDGT